MTEDAIRQRQEASRTHGAIAFEQRGEAALDQPARSRLEELKEQTQERAGVLTLMKERAANAIMMVELITSYIAEEVDKGTPLSKIPAAAYLPAYMNTAQRSLKDLYAVMPDDKDVLDIGETIAKAVKEHEERNT